MHKDICTSWETVRGFNNWDDYEDFLKWVSAEVSAGRAKSIPVATAYSEGQFDEHWYKCPDCNKIWRLVKPDPPFKGVFGRIDPNRPTDVLYEESK